MKNCENTTANKHENKTPKKPKQVWDKPVSKAFYAKMTAKVEKIIDWMLYSTGFRHELMQIIDRYLLDGSCPSYRWCDPAIMGAFCALRAEIDEAIDRSAQARLRAARRRELREKAKKATLSLCPQKQSVDEETPLIQPIEKSLPFNENTLKIPLPIQE